MKKILLGIALVGATSSAALAADLPSRVAPPVYVPPVMAPPVFTWSGFYAGVNAGYAFNGQTRLTSVGAGVGNGLAPARAQGSTDGFTGGGQIGYNVQIGHTPLPLLGALGTGLGGGGLVLGVEADAAYTDLDKTYGFGATALHADTDYIGTVRGRVGIAFANFMVYGTGGFAYGGVNNSIFAGNSIGSTNSIRTGYTYGGGIEYAIPTTSFVNVFHSSAVTLKVEYLHYDLGNQLLGAGTGPRAITSSVATQGDLVRAGINYKVDLFGAPAAAPVVARY